MQNTEKIINNFADSLKNAMNEQLVDTVSNTANSSSDYFDLIARFGINLVAIFILVRVLYYATHRNKEFLFTFFLFNILNFLICVLLSTTKIKIGFAFGLFAIFSIMRYRTVMVPIKEMGYFFVCVAIGIINALATNDNHYIVLLVCNFIILLLILFLDKFITLTHENVKEIKYERIDLIHPEKREEMMSDLIARTGLPIHRIEIRNINFLTDSAFVNVFYYAKHNENTQGVTGDDD